MTKHDHLPAALRPKMGRPSEGRSAARHMISFRISANELETLMDVAEDGESAGRVAKRLLLLPYVAKRQILQHMISFRISADQLAALMGKAEDGESAGRAARRLLLAEVLREEEEEDDGRTDEAQPNS